MNTCGTCKYFGEPVTELQRYDDDTLDPIPSKFHKCELLKMIRGEDEQDRLAIPAAVIDGSGYFAALCVKEEFGCNQWVARASGLNGPG